MNKVEFAPNTPVQMALKFPNGKLDQTRRFGDQMFFTLVDGRCMYLNLDVAAKIDALGLKRGEPFWLCKRWTGQRKDAPVWEAWTDAGEPPARPPDPPPAPPRRPLPFPAPTSGTDLLERQLRASLAEIERKKAEAVAPAPAPAAAPAAPSPAQSAHSTGNCSIPGKNGASDHSFRPPAYTPPSAGGSPLVKIPMDVALREIAQFTVAELKAAGMHMEGGPMQDLISTFVIGAMREGWIGVWQRVGAK
jgi:hypothetical protein